MRALGTRCLIVTGGRSARRSGALEDVQSALQAADIGFSVYDGIGQNPLVASCREAARMAVQQKAEFIVGIGGGSPLDAAKAVAVLVQDPDMEEETLFRMQWTQNPVPIVLVGTCLLYTSRCV